MRQFTRTKRRYCIGAFTVVAAPLLLASVASACTQLANLQANPSSGAAGSTIAVTGSRFRTDAASSPGPVEIRLDSRTNAPIATLPMASIVTSSGGISLSLTIPASAAIGYHTLIATQFNTATGALLSGFPVRAAYKVTAAGRESAADATPAPATSADPAAASATESGPATASPAAAPTAPEALSAVATPSAASAGAAAPAAASATAPVAATAASTRTDPAAPAAGGSLLASTAAAPESPAVAATAPPSLATASPAGATPTLETPTVVSSGLLPAAASGPAGALPGLTFALGGAMVLLSLAAFVKSGRSVLGGRRLPTVA